MDYIPNGITTVTTPITITFNEVLNNFSEEFIFRLELAVFAFFGVMLFLQYYTKQIEKKRRKEEKWINHIEYDLNISPIISKEYKQDKDFNFLVELNNKDKAICLISDVLFIPSLAFVLIFVGYTTGWYI